jgi:hypothetical protein
MMYFYRHPGWGIGFKVLMIVLIIAGGSFMARSAFQAGYMQGAAADASVDGAEVIVPMVYPHMKGYAMRPFGGSVLPILAIFLGGILLIKLITSIIGLIMFRKWKSEGGPGWEKWKGYRHHHPAFCGPYHHGGWGPFPYPPYGMGKEEEAPEETNEEDPS